MIVGGAGAFASLMVHMLLLNSVSKSRNPVLDSDFPRIEHISIPFKSMTSAGVIDQSLASEELLSALSPDILDNASAILLACFSLNPLLPKHSAIVNLVTTTLSELNPATRSLVLCSKSSRDSALFGSQSYLKYPSPALASLLDDVIADVINSGFSYKSELLSMVINQEIIDKDCSQVIIGCTEFLCVKFSLNVPIVNPVLTAINLSLEKYYASL